MSGTTTLKRTAVSKQAAARELQKKESGFVNSVEMLFLLTAMMCCAVMTTGIVGSKVASEFADLGNAIGSLNQSFMISGVAVGHPNDLTHPTDIAVWSGSTFTDVQDFCDQGASGGLRVCISPGLETPAPGAGGP